MSARVQQALSAPAAAPAPAAPALLLRKCACGGSSGPLGECEDCKKKRIDLKPRSLGSGWSGAMTGLIPTSYSWRCRRSRAATTTPCGCSASCATSRCPST